MEHALVHRAKNLAAEAVVDDHRCHGALAEARPILCPFLGPERCRSTPVPLQTGTEGSQQGPSRIVARDYGFEHPTFVNLELARAGYAQQLTTRPNVAHAGELAWAVAEAHASNRGLWAACLAATAAPTTTAPTTTGLPELGSQSPSSGVSSATVVLPFTTLATARPLTPAPTVAPRATSTTAAAARGCHPSYAAACVPIASDVDCAGGSGNGPAYVYEKNFQVVGPDEHGLDSDNDLVACESR